MSFNTYLSKSDNTVNLEHVVCAICHTDLTRDILIGHDRLNGVPGEFNLVKCLTCGLMYVNPRPTSDTISPYYPDDYGPYLSTQAHITSHYICKSYTYCSCFVQCFKKVLKLFCYPWKLAKNKLRRQGETELPIFGKPGKVLEIGCASGGYLAQLKAKGWICHGIDSGENPIRYARDQLGLDVHVSTVENMSFDHETFDLVVGWMVLEHLHNPIIGLNNIFNVLKPGGYFAFSVPNSGSWELKLFKNKWYALQLPCHLYHFDRSSLTSILIMSGFKIDRIIYQRNINNIIGSLWHLCEDITGNSVLTRLLKKWTKSNPNWLLLLMRPFAEIISYLKQSGRMTVWAIKPIRNE